MKFVIASDLHGSAYWCGKLMELIEQEAPHKILLLGDLLYHGPRNDLPRDYAPKQVIPMLSAYKERILCVRGNCEAEVDDMVLEFNVLADYALLFNGGKTFFLTHGHKFNPQNPPKLKKGDVLFNGHTHVSRIQETDTFLYVNPGSVSIPKENTPRGYVILTDEKIIHKNLKGEFLEEYTF